VRIPTNKWKWDLSRSKKNSPQNGGAQHEALQPWKAFGLRQKGIEAERLRQGRKYFARMIAIYQLPFASAML
jgi:hypothetical protein